MLAMGVNDNAGSLNASVVRTSIASMLAPTGTKKPDSMVGLFHSSSSAYLARPL